MLNHFNLNPVPLQSMSLLYGEICYRTAGPAGKTGAAAYCGFLKTGAVGADLSDSSDHSENFYTAFCQPAVDIINPFNRISFEQNEFLFASFGRYRFSDQLF